MEACSLEHGKPRDDAANTHTEMNQSFTYNAILEKKNKHELWQSYTAVSAAKAQQPKILYYNFCTLYKNSQVFQGQIKYFFKALESHKFAWPSKEKSRTLSFNL